MGTTRRLSVGALAVALAVGGWAVIGLNGEPTVTPPSTRVGQAQPMEYRQGVIIEWNPVTLANKVVVDRQTFENLPVLGVAEAAGFKIGAVVGIAVVGGSWAIVGRFVKPGTPEATDAITDLSQRVVTALVGTGEAAAAGPFADMATPGPSVTISIGVSGLALVFMSADMQVNADGALMGYVASGANTIAATANDDLFLRTTGAIIVRGQMSMMIPLTGLTPGSTTFTAKYAASTGAANLIARRRITVVAL